jgi:hypothetical protein
LADPDPVVDTTSTNCTLLGIECAGAIAGTILNCQGCEGILTCLRCAGQAVSTIGKCQTWGAQCCTPTACPPATCGTQWDGCVNLRQCDTCDVLINGVCYNGSCCQKNVCSVANPNTCGQTLDQGCGLGPIQCPPCNGCSSQLTCANYPPGTCGIQGNGCGGTIDCGPCCTPKTCAQLGLTCGPGQDGCGGTLDCGGCSQFGPDWSCNSTGKCECTAVNISPVDCGPWTDECGANQDKGPCPRAADGTSQTCVLGTCVPDAPPPPPPGCGAGCGVGCGGGCGGGGCGIVIELPAATTATSRARVLKH